MRSISRLGVGALAVAAMAAAGCGSSGKKVVDPVKVEQFLVNTFHQQFPQDSYKITCRRGVVAVAGKTFYCDDVGNTSGGSQEVCNGVQIVDSSGRVKILNSSNAPKPPCFKGSGGPPVST